MKKIYTLAAAMLATGFIGADAANLTPAKGLANFKEVSTEKALNVEIAAPAKKTTKSTRADGDWKALGEGTMREFMFSCWFKKGWDEDFAVEIEQNTADPSVYRIVNMYQNYSAIYDMGKEYLSYESATPNYAYITTFDVDGETKWFFQPDAETGVYVTPQFVQAVGGLSSGMITVQWINGSTLANSSKEELQAIYAKFPTIFGTFKDGVFTAPAKPAGLVYDDGTAVEWVIGAHMSDQQAGYIYFVNTKGQFATTLPGVEVPEPADPFDSYTYIGECDMQQNFLDNLFEEVNTPVAKVQVYEDPYAAGLFHIKNAYVAGAWNNEEQAKEIDLEIDLTDPNYGLIYDQTTGYVDAEFGSEVDICSASMVFTAYVAQTITKQTFLTDPQYQGLNLYLDKATKRIVMPAMSVWYFMPDIEDRNSEYYNALFPTSWAQAQDSWIQLPADYAVGGAGVNEINLDSVDGPARYYNLQGVEIANPTKGELVIVKKGSKSTKVIF